MKLVGNIQCSTESPENNETNISLNVQGLDELKEKFKMEMFQFQQFIIEEQNAKLEILDACKVRVSFVEYQ